MPRNPRASRGGYCYHVLNRGNGRRIIFRKDGDYAAFVKLLREAGERTLVRLLAYCLMPRVAYNSANGPSASVVVRSIGYLSNTSRMDFSVTASNACNSSSTLRY